MANQRVKPIRHYCTYFDVNYLTRGLALYESLRQQGGLFHLWVLCFDSASYDRLARLDLPELELISLEEFEKDDAPLLTAKQNRSLIEYYFTCTPTLPLFIFRKAPFVETITYLDSDIYFFADPELAHAECGSHSICITPHRFPPILTHLERYGIFNVGWLTFRRDEQGLACLTWWRERCLEWCYDRAEPSRFGDQKYLDDWPERFQNVKVLDHPGVNVAPWNLACHRLSMDRNTVLVDGEPLVLFHFHGLKEITSTIYDPQWEGYGIERNTVLSRQIYCRYLRQLQGVERRHRVSKKVDTSLRFPSVGSTAPKVIDLIQGVVSRKYFFVTNGFCI